MVCPWFFDTLLHYSQGLSLVLRHTSSLLSEFIPNALGTLLILLSRFILGALVHSIITLRFYPWFSLTLLPYSRGSSLVLLAYSFSTLRIYFQYSYHYITTLMVHPLAHLSFLPSEAIFLFTLIELTKSQYSQDPSLVSQAYHFLFSSGIFFLASLTKLISSNYFQGLSLVPLIHSHFTFYSHIVHTLVHPLGMFIHTHFNELSSQIKFCVRFLNIHSIFGQCQYVQYTF